MIRKLCFLLILFIFCTLFTGCFDSDEVDELAFVVALGIDEGKTNNYKVTFQIAKTAGMAGGEGGGDGGGEKSSMAVTVEGPSVMSSLNIANTFVSKKLNLSHAKVIVFSEGIAKKGIEPLIRGLPRIREIRPNIDVVISRDTAEDYIKSVKPPLEKNHAKYYEMQYSNFNYTAFTESIDLHTFSCVAKSDYQNPVATLGGVSKYEKSQDISNKASTFREKGRPYAFEGDYKAGDLPKVGDIKAEIMGLAVFKEGKMVGELDGEETMFHLMLNGNFVHAYITIPDPLDPEAVVILDTFQSRNPVQKVRFENGKPVIDVKISLEANILAIQSGLNYEDPQKAVILEKAYNDFIKKGMEGLLYKTAKVYDSDIFGFGKTAKGKFLTWGEWEQFNWFNRYKDSTFNVTADLKIRRTGLMIRTVPVR